MKQLKIYVYTLLIFSLTSAMENPTLIRRRLHFEEELYVGGNYVRNSMELSVGPDIEDEPALSPCGPSLLKRFAYSDLCKASILLLIAGITTWSSVTPSAHTTHNYGSFNHTNMCPRDYCSAERSAGFKQGMIYSSLAMSGLLCCSQCAKMCKECGE